MKIAFKQFISFFLLSGDGVVGSILLIYIYLLLLFYKYYIYI